MIRSIRRANVVAALLRGVVTTALPANPEQLLFGIPLWSLVDAPFYSSGMVARPRKASTGDSGFFTRFRLNAPIHPTISCVTSDRAVYGLAFTDRMRVGWAALDLLSILDYSNEFVAVVIMNGRAVAPLPHIGSGRTLNTV